MELATSPLLTDLYQLNMVQAYLERGQTEIAVFEFFVRSLPNRRGFLIGVGLQQALEHLETVRFSSEDIAWLARSGRFKPALIDRLAAFRFTGHVHAMPEGTPFFANEPLLRVTAPLPEGQLVETTLINILHFQMRQRPRAWCSPRRTSCWLISVYAVPTVWRRACWLRGRAISPASTERRP